MPTLEPAIYSHLDTGGGKEEEADKEYASLIHWKTETGGASVDVQPELYGKLSTHHLVCLCALIHPCICIIICVASLCFHEPVC